MRVEMGESGSDRTSSGALLVGGVAAILASTCCLGPLVLVALGLTGAWIGTLTLLEPYRPFFIGGALVALFFAGRRIFRPARACEPGENVRSTANPSGVQSRIRDSFSARSHCAGISVCGQVFLLTLS